jgi:hypothetical protein
MSEQARILPPIIFIGEHTDSVFLVGEDHSLTNLTILFQKQELRDKLIHDNMPSMKRVRRERAARIEAEQTLKLYNEWVEGRTIQPINKRGGR